MEVKAFVDKLDQIVGIYTGVPDSLLKDFCAYLHDHKSNEEHIITANEGNAVGIAAGNYLSTGKSALVYLQNSGIGNIVNPLLSLLDEKVYQIPALFLIGWRGEPGKKDEPQHIRQGELTLSLLECMGVEYSIISENSDIDDVLKSASKELDKRKPYALVVQKGTFSSYSIEENISDLSSLNREFVIEEVAKAFPDDLFVSTTGKISRELFEVRENHGNTHSRDFLVVGSMGHTSSIAMGVALGCPDKRVICLDGDGSLLMHMGALAVNGQLSTNNMVHIVLNNGAHDTVGGQPTCAAQVNLSRIAENCGYDRSIQISTMEQLRAALENANESQEKGRVFIEVLVKKGARKELGRPTISAKKCGNNFLEQING